METQLYISPQSAFRPVMQLVPSVPEEVCFSDLLSEAIDVANLELVIAPLIGASFDAVELIELLGDAGFRGRLHVTSGPLPDLLMVQAELRAAARAFGFRVDLACRA